MNKSIVLRDAICTELSTLFPGSQVTSISPVGASTNIFSIKSLTDDRVLALHEVVQGPLDRNEMTVDQLIQGIRNTPKKHWEPMINSFQTGLLYPHISARRCL